MYHLASQVIIVAGFLGYENTVTNKNYENIFEIK
jgi:hypothetical protein